MKNIKTSIILIALTCTTNVFAASYYVRPTGNDNANGLSHATAWKSISKVNKHRFKTGDDVYLLSGSKWNDRLAVDWQGTPQNRVIIGSYYINNGVVKIGVKPNSKKPTLSGSYPLFEKAGARPSKRYQGLVQVYANYVTVQNIRVEKSSGNGIILVKNYHHAIFENNEVDTTAGSSMVFGRKTHSNIMRNNIMRRCAMGWKDKKWKGTWPLCNGAVGSRNNLIESNLVTDSYGEGIVAFDVGANNNVIRNNTIVVVRTVGIYVDNGANNIVENNIVVGDSTGKGNKGVAFALSVEDYPKMRHATGNIFRNNLAANTVLCFWVGMEPKASAGGYKVGGEFIGNTCTGMNNTLRSVVKSNNIQAFTISNNIFYNIKKDNCTFANTSKVDFHYNLWQVKPKRITCQGNGDVVANAKLTRTNWKNTNPNNIPKATDFRPRVGSPVHRNGLNHPKVRKDYFGKARPALPTIGAIEVTK